MDGSTGVLDRLAAWLATGADYAWGWPTMGVLALVGIWLTIRLRGLQFRRLGMSLGMVLGHPSRSLPIPGRGSRAKPGRAVRADDRVPRPVSEGRPLD